MYDKRIKHGLFFSILIAFCFLGMAATILPAQAEEQVEEVNTGQDFTKPLTRLDIRQKYQWLASDHFAAMTTFRVDKPFVLASKWVLGTRFDLPLMATDVVSGDNPDGDNQFGVSHANEVLDRARDAAGNVQVRCDDFARLADLM